MLQLKILSCLICFHGLIGSLHGADKYTDENRPYEFGFNIEGEQHRHEKKDENGLIMGEFGFITADGVYHVTVYATDEQGRFKILSMKNIRVKPYPTAGDDLKKGRTIPFPPSKNTPVVQGPSASNTLSAKQESKPVQINKQISSQAKSCSHCSIPTTTIKTPPTQLTDIAIVSKDRPLPAASGLPTSNNYQQNTPILSSSRQSGQQRNDFRETYPTPSSEQQSRIPSSNFDQNNIKSPQDSFGNIQQNYQQPGFSGNQNSSPSTYLNYPQGNNNGNTNIPRTNQDYLQNGANTNTNNPQFGNGGIQSNPNYGNSGKPYYSQEKNNAFNNNPQKENNANQYYPQQQVNTNSGYPQSEASLVQPLPKQQFINNSQKPKDAIRNPKQYNDYSNSNFETDQPQGFGAAQGNQPVPNKPTLFAAQMQIVSKDTDIHHRNPGEEAGLPDGLSKDDMTHLLYTFNYTVGFHGHYEEGYSNGAKSGYYYVTGRNGIRTRVDYIADEKGFRPKISQEVLDLISDDVPKPETEKDEKFGLKGYEFKWIYYPRDERK